LSEEGREKFTPHFYCLHWLDVGSSAPFDSSTVLKTAKVKAAQAATLTPKLKL
jgi:hypothetical protein